MRRVPQAVSAAVGRPSGSRAAALALALTLLAPVIGAAGAALIAPTEAWAAPKKPPKGRATKEKASKDKTASTKPPPRAPAPGARPAKEARAPRPAAPATPPRDERVEIEVIRERLPGGVELAVVPVPSAPVLVVTVVDGAGAASDPPGRGGRASLFSHLGGAAASPERRDRLVAERGGEHALRVGPDDVVSTYVLPPGELELALWLEADRLTARADEAALVDALRALAEHRSAEPFARHREKIDALAFQGWAPYAHAPDGTADELLAIRRDVLAGVLTARPPRPIAVVVAGPVERATAVEAARRHLGAIATAPVAPPAGQLPDQINQRAATVVDARTRTAAILLGFAVPMAAVSADGPALEVAAAVLAGGPRSRLARSLIEEGSVSTARAWLDRRGGPSMFRLEVQVAPGGDPVTVRERVERAVLELGKGAPRPDELDRARAWLAVEESASLARPRELAARIGRAVVAGAPTSGWDLGRWREVTGDAVARAVDQHLSPIRRNVVEVHPERPLEPPPTVAPRPAPRAAPAPRGASKRAPKGGKPTKKKGGRR